MHHGIMIPMSANPAKMEIDEDGLIVGVSNQIRTMRYFGECFTFSHVLFVHCENIVCEFPKSIR